MLPKKTYVFATTTTVPLSGRLTAAACNKLNVFVADILTEFVGINLEKCPMA